MNQMEPDLSDRIRERAYEIWIETGYRDGEAEQHWLAAEQEVLSAQFSAAVPSAPAKRVRGRATPKRSRDEFLGARPRSRGARGFLFLHNGT
jgi:hypothetical protein